MKRPDEMEMAINFKSMRLSWAFVVVALLAWMVADYIITGVVPVVPFLIVCIQNIIFFGSKLYMTRKMAANNDEK